MWLAPKSELITQLFLLFITSKKQFTKFSWISNDENYSKFNISHILGLKTTKPPPWNPTHQALPIECVPSIFFSFNSIEFQWQICSIVNNTCTVTASIMKLQNDVHLLIEGFLIRVPRAWWGVTVDWERSQLDNQTKASQLPFLRDICEGGTS